MKIFCINGLFFFILTVLLACQDNTKYESDTLDKGVEYELFKKGDNSRIAPHWIVKVRQRVFVADSLIFSSYKAYPNYQIVLPAMEAEKQNNYIGLLLLKASKGDSIVFKQNLDSLRQYAYLPIQKSGKIEIQIQILDAFQSEQEAEADRIKEVAHYKQEEYLRLKNYLETNGIKVTQTQEGIFVQYLGKQINNEGRLMCSDSCTAIVRYEGRLFNNRLFDENFTKREPFKVKLNTHQVIPGFEYALHYMNVGDSIKAYIPSMLAYREGGNKTGEVKPFENVIFKLYLEQIIHTH